MMQGNNVSSTDDVALLIDIIWSVLVKRQPWKDSVFLPQGLRTD